MPSILLRGFLFVFVVFFIVSPVLAVSEDDGLYAPPPPEGSAFVRFIHAQAELEGDFPPEVNGKERDGVVFAGVKPYGAVEPGKVHVKLGPVTFDFEAEPEVYYTLILQNSTFRVVKDPPIQNMLKSQIIVYNMTSRDDISLKTADGKVTVVGPLAADEIKDRDINPVKVSLVVFSGDDRLADSVDWPLERKRSYAVAVFEKEGDILVTYEPASVYSD